MITEMVLGLLLKPFGRNRILSLHALHWFNNPSFALLDGDVVGPHLRTTLAQSGGILDSESFTEIGGLRQSEQPIVLPELCGVSHSTSYLHLLSMTVVH